MAGTHFSGPLTVAGVEVISDAGAIVGDIQATAGSIGTAELAAGVLSADADGREKMASSFFNDPSTVSDKFDDGSMPGSILQDDSLAGKKMLRAADLPSGPGLVGSTFLYGIYDFATQGGTQGAIVLTSDQLADGHVVKNAYYQVDATLTSATDAATVAISIEGADDLVSAIAINNNNNPWDQGAGWVQMIPDNAVGNFIDITDNRSLTATVGVEDLTAGTIVFILEVISV